MAPILVFDIETIPDIAGLRLLRGFDPALSDADVHAAEVAERAARNKSDFMPLHLHRVLVISCVFRSGQTLRIRSFADLEPDGRSDEASVIQSFFTRVEDHRPQLVSWNGGGFDLPVLQQRGLRHGVVAGRYWDMGQDAGSDREHRYNNYISRYHLRHVDLMDLLAMYAPKANAPLDAMAKLCGFPGKLGMDGSQVYAAYRDGRRDEIRRYCETDVMNTWLLWCRFEKMRGRLDARGYEREMALARETIGGIDEPHWREYLAAWPGSSPLPLAGEGEGEGLRDSQPDSPGPHPGPLPQAGEGGSAPVLVVEQLVEAVVETTSVYIDDSSIRT